ncbi:hypothetical protein BBJ28_00007534 [Nothophytophthora sp. Chile5]|nr:hypothetical protein BBJ28_00007534 [Nothophytophthora sp. Chile5]
MNSQYPMDFSETYSGDLSGGSLPEEMRCQYSSKRCENERTNKKSGGLHKFCAMHREKANRNQMRLDHRRRVNKQQQKEMLRQQQAQQSQQQQMQRRHSNSVASMAAGQNFHFGSRMRPQLRNTKPTSSPTMAVTTPMQSFQAVAARQEQPVHMPLFDQHDLEILEALLFSSDEEQSDATPVHCSQPQLWRSPSFVNV